MAQAQANRKKENSQRKAAVPPPSSTPARDEVYGLVSVLYHALQGSETYGQYVNDAEQSGDDELTLFFEECRDEENRRATQAKTLLAVRLGGEDDDEDDNEEEDEDADDDES
jgi:hypothetical protein